MKSEVLKIIKEMQSSIYKIECELNKLRWDFNEVIYKEVICKEYLTHNQGVAYQRTGQLKGIINLPEGYINGEGNNGPEAT